MHIFTSVKPQLNRVWSTVLEQDLSFRSCSDLCGSCSDNWCRDRNVVVKSVVIYPFKRRKPAWFGHVTHHYSFSGHHEGWAVPWLAEGMLDGQHQSVDIPAHARTAHKGLLRKRGSWLNRPSCPRNDPISQGTELNWCSCNSGSRPQGYLDEGQRDLNKNLLVFQTNSLLFHWSRTIFTCKKEGNYQCSRNSDICIKRLHYWNWNQGERI